MRFLRDTVITLGDASGTLNSAIIDSNQLLSVSLQAEVVGTAAGTLIIQYSNDFAPNDNPTNFSPIPSATVAIAGVGVYSIPKIDLCYRWLRVNYTATSGTGSLTANLMALSI